MCETARKVVLEALRRALAAGHTDGTHAQRLIFLLNTSQAVPLVNWVQCITVLKIGFRGMEFFHISLYWRTPLGMPHRVFS